MNGPRYPRRDRRIAIKEWLVEVAARFDALAGASRPPGPAPGLARPDAAGVLGLLETLFETGHRVLLEEGREVWPGDGDEIAEALEEVGVIGPTSALALGSMAGLRDRLVDDDGTVAPEELENFVPEHEEAVRRFVSEVHDHVQGL